MTDTTAAIEMVRSWLSTGFLAGIFAMIAYWGKPISGAWIEWLKLRAKARADDRAADQRQEVHRDELTFQLLATAKAEVSQLVEEVQRLRPMELHIVHLKEALDHLDRLMRAHGDAAEWLLAERSARAFVNRMNRVDEAKGVLTNEAQRLDSEIQSAARRMGPYSGDPA